MINLIKDVIYDENLLLSEFTFGFELEGYIDYDDDIEIFQEKFKDIIIKHFKESSTISKIDLNLKDDGSITSDAERCDICDGTGEIKDFCDYCNGDGCSDCYNTGIKKISCDECNGKGYYGSEANNTFEWASPIFKLTTENVYKIINFFDDLFKNTNVSTNTSCSLHIHIGLPYRKDLGKDLFWLLLNIASDYKNIKFVSSYKNIKLYNHTYASTNRLEEMHNMLEYYDSMEYQLNDVMEQLKNKFYNTNKYTTFRQHPQGTLEWRGPRGFMDTRNLQIIKGFFIEKLIPLLKMFSTFLAKKEIVFNNFTINRHELYNYLNVEIINKPEMKDIRFDKNVDRQKINKLYNSYSFIRRCNFELLSFELEPLILTCHEWTGDVPESASCEIFSANMLLKGNIYAKNISIKNDNYNNIMQYNSDEIFLNASDTIKSTFLTGVKNIKCKTLIRSNLKNCIIDVIDIYDSFITDKTIIKNCELIKRSEFLNIDTSNIRYAHNSKFKKCIISKNSNFEFCKFTECIFDFTVKEKPENFIDCDYFSDCKFKEEL